MASNEVLRNPCVSAETLEERALIGLYVLAADYEVGTSGSQSPDLGDMWKYGCPKKPQQRVPGHWGNPGQCEVVVLILEDWELGRAALSCHVAMDLSLPRNEGELRVVGVLPFTVITVPVKFSCGTAHSNKAVLSPWKGGDKKGVGCGERKIRRKRDRSCLLSGPAGIFCPSKFVVTVNTQCLFGATDSVVSNVPLCFGKSSEGRPSSVETWQSDRATLGLLTCLCNLPVPAPRGSTGI